MGRLYRPRVLLELSVPVKTSGSDVFETINFPCRVQRARWTQNDHAHADTLSVTLDWQDAGTDPRYIAGAIGTFFLGSADDFGNWEPGESNVRFIGRMVRPMRRAAKDNPLLVECEFHDYTSFFLLAKPFASKGVPEYSQSLGEAWIRICENVPGAEPLADNIELRGLTALPHLGDAVAERFRKLGKVPVTPGTDAWGVWQQCVGMMGLISFFDRDICVVTTATDYYTAKDPPVLVWGRNLLSMEEQRNNDRTRRGIGLTSFDPLTGNAIEALWPPVGDQRVQGKRLTARKRKKPTADALRAQEERDYFSYPGITDPDRLLELAKTVYEVRSRQEMEGTVATSEMALETVSGAEFDLLTLRSGDVIRVEFDAEDREVLASIGTESARVAYLVTRGYEVGIARVMARNVGDLPDLEASFYVKSVTTELASSRESGSFNVEIQYCNRILLSGAATTT